MSFDTGAYGGVFAELISEKRLNPLDGGEENTAAKKRARRADCGICICWEKSSG